MMAATTCNKNQPPFANDGDISKRIDVSFDSTTTDATEEWMTGSSSNDDIEEFSTAGQSDESSTKKSAEEHRDDQSYEHRRRSIHMSPSHRRTELAFDVTNILNSLTQSEHQDSTGIYWPFSRSTKVSARASCEVDPTEELVLWSASESFCDDISVAWSSLEETSKRSDDERMERLQDEKSDDCDFSLSHEFNEDDMSFSWHTDDESPQQSPPTVLFDESENEDVYYDEPHAVNTIHRESAFRIQQCCDVDQVLTKKNNSVIHHFQSAQKRLNHGWGSSRCDIRTEFHRGKCRVESLDRIRRELEEVRNEMKRIRRKDSKCDLSKRRDFLEFNRTIAVLTLRISQIYRAQRHFMYHHQNEGTIPLEELAIPGDILTILAILPELSPTGITR